MKVHTPRHPRAPHRCEWCNQDSGDHPSGEYEEHQILLEANTDDRPAGTPCHRTARTVRQKTQ